MRMILITAACASSVSLVLGLSQCSRETNTAAAATYVGRSSCVECHEDEVRAYTGSHHDLAMQEVRPDTVLGNFDDTSFEHFGVTSRFFRRGDKFMVHTEGPDGQMRDYEIAKVFGVAPLQQYLVEFPGGRLQALSICWDSRPAEDGGQRWYHLYADEKIDSQDPLHWTKPSQNWNHMCANCHSTELRKNYNVASGTYATTWSEIDVSCEACHGPASAHVDWAKSSSRSKSTPHAGFAYSLRDFRDWRFTPGSPSAKRTPNDKARIHTEICARCHSRRGTEVETSPSPVSILDTHRLALLEPHLYHADGQILDEVYVYGSFVQSKMHHNGVSCADCHEPHSQKLLVSGNGLCVRCHERDTFDTPSHHHHEAGTEGAQCVSCHMPSRTYMGVDARRDHSFRVPRPDLTARIGTPNACTGCHAQESAKWAADAIRSWKGGDYAPPRHYAEALDAGRRGTPGAANALRALIADASKPAIARATALTMLERYPGRATLESFRTGLTDPEPVVRAAAAEALESVPARLKAQLGIRVLEDPVRGVRTAGARAMADTVRDGIAPEAKSAFESALREYQESLPVNADQTWAWSNRAMTLQRLGQTEKAQQYYETALRLEPTWVPAWTNLADLHRSAQRDDLCESTLRRGLAATDSPDLHHALGLCLARRKRIDESVRSLAKAARMQPANAQFGYAYAVALFSHGSKNDAIRELTRCHTVDSTDRQILIGLATMNRDVGNRTAAVQWARKLVALQPSDRGALQLLRSLEQPR